MDVYALSGLAVGDRSFAARFPVVDPDHSFAALRAREYGRLDAADHAYLDYAGGGLHAAAQVAAHAALLGAHVLGSPRSNNPTPQAATALVDEARGAVCEFFGAPPDEHACVFAANATGALKLVGELKRSCTPLDVGVRSPDGPDNTSLALPGASRSSPGFLCVT